MPKKRPNPMNCDTYDYWIFDLDNTLYDIKLSLFKRVSIRITQFIINYFGITKNEALKLQRELYLKYGLTLRGLIVEKKIEPQDFLKYVHDVEFPELKIDNELKSLLSKLKGKKYIYTNASYQHAKNILTLLGVMEEFEYILDIEATNFIPKPNIESYQIMKKKLCLKNKDMDKAIFIEDTARNLVPAKNLGMSTVWMENSFNANDFKKNFTYIDYSFKNVKSFLKFIKI
mgnify:CR=1 FL=1